MNSRIVLFAIFALTTCSVSTLVQARPLDPLSSAEIDARTADFVQTPWAGKSTNKGTTNDNGCLMSTFTITVDDPKTQTTRNVDILVQAPDNAKGPVPVVIIVPTIDGVRSMLEPVAARNLCNAGMGSMIADVNDMTPPKSYPAWGAEDLNNRRAILALRSTIDLAEHMSRFDKTKIAVLGFSLGGITASMLVSVEPRLKAAVIIVGGGNLPHILATSDEGHVGELRDNRMKAAGFKTVEEYENALRTSVTYDPFYFAPRAQMNKIMMVMASDDVKVPYEDQHQQFIAFGKPESMTFTGGHVATIVSMIYWYFDDVTNFLNKRFNAPALDLVNEPVRHRVIDIRHQRRPHRHPRSH